jgi:2-methylfumaryl-CoA isomerase
VAIDFSSPKGREIVQALICANGEAGGVFVTNFPANGFLSDDNLRRQRPDLITTRIMGWADGSPALDYTVNAAVGVPYMTGPAETSDRPVNNVLPAWDLLTGAYAAFATLAAERHRRMTGEGQEIRIPLSDIAIASMGNMGQIAEVLAGDDRPKIGNDLFGAFGRDFRTADGMTVMVVALTPRQWKGLVAALSLENKISQLEKALDVSFATDEGLRYRHRDVLNVLVETAISQRSADELAGSFDANGVCWGPYRSLKDAVRNEPRLVADNPVFSHIQHPSGAHYPTPGAAATFVGQLRGTPCPAPRLGEHTEQVLSELIGCSQAQIGSLLEQGLAAHA